MGAYEHVISLLSFVFALAITHLLLTVAGLVRHWPRVRFSWGVAFWALNALVTTLANWISFWDMRTMPAWGVGTIFFTFALSFVTYLQVALVCPDIPQEGTIDLPRFHAEQSQRYIGAFALTGVFALVANAVFGTGYNVAEWSQQNIAVIPMLAASLLAVAVRARWAQIISALTVVAAWAYYFVALQSALR